MSKLLAERDETGGYLEKLQRQSTAAKAKEKQIAGAPSTSPVGNVIGGDLTPEEKAMMEAMDPAARGKAPKYQQRKNVSSKSPSKTATDAEEKRKDTELLFTLEDIRHKSAMGQIRAIRPYCPYGYNDYRC